MKTSVPSTIGVALLLGAWTAELRAQGTAFTYQARMADSGVQANGNYDLTFALFNAPTDGSGVGMVNVANDLFITNGLFTVDLDFGSAAFDGSGRWLQIAVRPGASTGPYTNLAPRQPITPAPYAITAGSVTGPINGNAIVNGSISGAKLASNSITTAQLAPGAAAANLQASGQSGVAAGGMILSSNYNDAALLSAGYLNLGKVTLGGIWEPQRSGSPLAPRFGHTAIWTGREMIVWGGTTNSGPPGFQERCAGDGSRYDPTLSRWVATRIHGAPGPRFRHTAVWTGTEMIVWGGDMGRTNLLGNGARYNPTTDTWTALTTSNAPSPRADHIGVWTGREMIIWGGSGRTNNLMDGARYDPVSDRWTAIASNSAPVSRLERTAVWTGTRMIVWGDYGRGQYDPATDTWTAISTRDAPTARARQTATWTGREMIIWLGYSSDPSGGGASNISDSAGRYDPVSNTWRPITAVGAPGPSSHTAVWTGSEMITWAVDSGGRYNPAADTWTSIPTGGAPPARTEHTAVWTGNEMIVWGGKDQSGVPLNDTYSYVPARVLYLYQRP